MVHFIDPRITLLYYSDSLGFYYYAYSCAVKND